MEVLMRKTPSTPAFARGLGAVAVALFMQQAPAIAAGAITTFNVKNCTSERVFVCSFDKTDSLMKIPYKAAGVQAGDRKEFGCASLGKCKVIIGVSKKKSKDILSAGMTAAVAAGSATSAAIAGATGVGAAVMTANATVVFSLATATTTLAQASTIAVLSSVSTGAAIVAVGAGAAVAAIAIADGWSDGEVCNQVRKAAQKAGLKPKFFLKNGKAYRVVEKYAASKKGNQYVNPDGTAVLAYNVTSKLNSCPAPLKAQLVPN
jgi:hypothetical protein